jgi:acyl-CoA dehydrogenase
MLTTTTESDLCIPVKANDYADICETVNKICANFPAKYWRDLEDRPLNERFPQAFVNALSAAGIAGALVPEAHGGIGLPVAAIAAIIETIHASGCNGSVLIPQFTLTFLLACAGADEIKATLLPKIAEGASTILSLACQAPDDLNANTLAARKSGSNVVISGESARVVAPNRSDFMVVAANEEGRASLFLIELARIRQQGLVIELIEELTASNVAHVRFEAVEFSATSRIGGAGTGATILGEADVLRRILEAAAAIGDGRFFSRRGAKYANERVVFGNPIGAYQGIQFPLARAHIEVEAAFLGLRRAIAMFDAGKDAALAASVARHLAMEAAWNMADAAFTTHGGFAFAREYDIERKWRDVRAAKLARLPEDDDLKKIGASQLGFAQLA